MENFWRRIMKWIRRRFSRKDSPIQFPEESETNLDEEKIELLLFEYEQCNLGYNSRDYIAEDEFAKLIQAFFTFMVLLLAVNFLAVASNFLRISMAGILGVLGFLAFLSLLLDLEGTCSVKQALRDRALRIESILRGREPSLWKRTEVRTKYFEERLLKKVQFGIKLERENEGQLFVLSGRILMVLWIVMLIIIIRWGGSLHPVSLP